MSPQSLLGRKWTWRSRINATLVLVTAAGLVAFLGLAVVSNFNAASDAVHSLDTARTLTAARITKLNAEIAHLSAQDARAQRQRGVLIAEVKDLTRQLRALGVTPIAHVPQFGPPAPHRSTVVIHRTSRPSPRPTVTATRTARPPSPSQRPTPKQTRSKCATVNLPVIGCP